MCVSVCTCARMHVCMLVFGKNVCMCLCVLCLKYVYVIGGGV